MGSREEDLAKSLKTSLIDKQFEFRISRTIEQKPVPSPPVRSHTIEIRDPRFLIDRIGPLHTLELSKHCVHRPSIVLRGNVSHDPPQHLNIHDFKAVQSVMNTMKTELMALFDHGVEAGSYPVR
jgi:hypothetical protein